ncbi:GD18248 [Drosophila simulans]|uniref:GD18248 n=1 Tax=Drosophila simulans TaxID=7240 RepID=B4QU83_DROSI|nr:GD18248 [Drosophila simulans]
MQIQILLLQMKLAMELELGAGAVAKVAPPTDRPVLWGSCGLARKFVISGSRTCSLSGYEIPQPRSQHIFGIAIIAIIAISVNGGATLTLKMAHHPELDGGTSGGFGYGLSAGNGSGKMIPSAVACSSRLFKFEFLKPLMTSGKELRVWIYEHIH